MSVEKDYKIVYNPRQKNNFTPNENIFYDVIIIGAGVSGLAAAMYAGRLGMKTLLIGEMLGGTITLTHVVENYPGFVSITRQGLAKLIENHTKDYDINIINEKIEIIKKNERKNRIFFEVQTKKKTFSGKTIIYATGSKWKKLEVPGEKEFENKGVSYCALCDGPLFRGKTVGVVGGSDSAVKETLLLTEFAKKVYVFYRGKKVHPEPINMQRLEEKIKQKKVEVINNTNVIEIKGGQIITSIILDKPHKGNKEFKIDGLFVDIGHIPLSNMAKKIGVKINKKEEIIINRNAETNIEGFYAAGDVTDTEFKQAITGVGEGVAAAYHAYEYINKGEYVLPQEDKEYVKEEN